MEQESSSPGRTVAKRQAIIDAARTLFLRNGYSGTTMDEVAAHAKVSKQTVYKQFGDKERLFGEIVTGDIAEAESSSQDELDALADSDDFEAALHRFARRHITAVLQPHLIRMRRMIISEATRFPQLARTWWERGPARGHETLACVFESAARRGHLHLDEPLLAAEHFNWLVLSIPLNRALFLGDDERFGDEELGNLADEAVRIFLAAYGAEP